MRTLIKQNTPVILIAAVVLLSACGSSLKISSDYDKSVNFSAFKTFSVYNLKTTGSVSQLNADRLAAAMRNEMIKKGYTEDKNNPDLMVNGVAVLKDKQDVSASTNYYGWGGIYRPYGFYHTMPMATSTTVNTYNYKAGTFIIDVVDAKANKAVWESTGKKDFDRQLKNPEEEINTGVAKMMESFPAAK
jgi:hypothetical protein